MEYKYDASIEHPTEVYLNSDCDIKIINKETGDEIDHQFVHVDRQANSDFGIEWFKQDIKITGPHLDGVEVRIEFNPKESHTALYNSIQQTLVELNIIEN